MPGWPTVDRADDHELVEALRRADADAPAKLYDSYGERLHDYAHSLSEPADVAADAVHDALVTAQGCVARLKEPARLRAWLYALTRFQVRARLAHRAGPTPSQPEPDSELSGQVYETLGELRRSEREILELSLRHGLTPAEAGAVLGLTSRQTAARLARARDHLENAAAAVVLARTGRAHCPDLSAMLDSWEGPLTPLLRRRLSGHVGGCEVCTEGRHRHVSAARLLEMVPVAYPPLSLRRRVIDTCVNPERDQTRTLITDRGDSFDRTGFPVTLEYPSNRRRPRRLAPLVLAGAALLAATGAMVVINGRDASTSGALRPTPSPTVSAAEETPTPDPVIGHDSLTPSPAPTPRRTRSATPSGRPAAARPRNTRPAPVPTRRRAVPGARLGVSCPGTIDGEAGIGLRARNATVSWVATASQGLDVRPASGSIRAGGSVTIQVTVADPAGSGSGRVSFTSSGGPATCSLSWHGGPSTAGPPTDEPTETEEPTPTPGEGVATAPDDASKGNVNVK
ncbi:RNA polymerase sigma factor, sigma-70 family [Nonomuraea solani]|uniref:RNA polymerase sigma factor, sigma-70 family n=1 Tax=Nonomuraea solani TaxID=1144553 RepID=A0A1H6EXA2_9ACTN|nr:sigma-70 family RNA polymerase sigma factor [Nonomuraea solani]SEH02498.1 RNA polymerase sigma factor, sigma-70 family [Nonomuraea solani]